MKTIRSGIAAAGVLISLCGAAAAQEFVVGVSGAITDDTTRVGTSFLKASTVTGQGPPLDGKAGQQPQGR